MTFRNSLYSCFLLLLILQVKAQDRNYSLDLFQVITLAQSDAPDALLAETRFTNASWRYKSYLANYKPQLDLGATIPDLSRTIDAITLPDGTEKFINRSLLNSSAFTTLTQNIPLTGGSIFAYSSLRRLDILKTSTINASKSYLTTPISINIQQPLFQFNPMKWDRILSPIEYEESQKEYSEDMEEVAYQAVQYFFDVLNAQLNLEAANQERANADTLFEIGSGRYQVGKIAETELLQLELRVMNADAALAEAELNLQTSTEQLRNHLGIREATSFNLLSPDEIPDIQISPQDALDQARLNRSDIISYRRRQLEADRDVEQEKKSQGVNLDINGRFGLTQTSTTFSDAYANPLDQEVFTLRLTVPIADWGKQEARKQIALSNQKLIYQTIEQEKVNFERDILIKVQQLDLKRESVTRATKALEAAEKRLDLTHKRYVIGKVDITELNLANNEREKNRQAYITALRNFWEAYYEIRLLTLYDFINKKPLLK